MKFLAVLILVSSLLSSSVFAASNIDQRAAGKVQVTKIYNELSQMDAVEYAQTMGTLAKAAADHGEVAQARILEKLKNDPASQQEILGQLKEKLDDASENGLFLLVYLASPYSWCRPGDFVCGYLVVVLSILTLEGEQASEI